MKRMILVSTGFLLLLLVACSNDKVSDKEEENKSENVKQTEEVTNEEKDAAEFRSMNVKYNEVTDTVAFEGEAISTNGVVYYSVEQLGTEIVPEEKVELKDEREWETIKATLNVADVPEQDEAAVFVLYTKDKEGNPVSQNHFPANIVQMR